ncbi:MAG TPA: NUDIX hydrolase [Galbitalea sp.]|jgi:8-oxo-dGTP pyrophosphatase MutT (NUDIX family)
MDTSFKAVILDSANRVLLGFNRRGEWELLGGRAEPQDNTPEETIRREVQEEAGLAIDIFELLDIWYYDIPTRGRVAVASYRASVVGGQQLTRGDEHDDVAFFDVKKLDRLPLPDGYRKSIRLAAAARAGK